jgi:hypothetical protein
MTACEIDLESFLDEYIQAALFTSNDESTPSGGEPFDRNYGPDDIAPETLDKMRADCVAFLAHPNGGRLIEIAERLEAEGKYVCPARETDVAGYAAHDFWLTRNGHGAGFWETWEWPKGMGKTLDETAKGFGTFDLYLGDDGLIYGA